ncbi:nipblb [Symbiodinium natans]|uniref:Nipblb protein n=1 Tax=Symbiodinium natans TaxID=878477 RepID=A0A812J3Q0_9DINO|nr:nipblb [Symbiodinium natans]CAE7373343.1 nipblb [Symbiodinium natans]
MFASLGCYGRQPGHEERDLHRWLQGLYGIGLELYWTTMKLQAGPRGVHASSCTSFRTAPPYMQVPTSTRAEDVDVPVLLPHEILHALAHAGPAQAAGVGEELL